MSPTPVAGPRDTYLPHGTATAVYALYKYINIPNVRYNIINTAHRRRSMYVRDSVGEIKIESFKKKKKKEVLCARGDCIPTGFWEKTRSFVFAF